MAGAPAPAVVVQHRDRDRDAGVGSAETELHGDPSPPVVADHPNLGRRPSLASVDGRLAENGRELSGRSLDLSVVVAATGSGRGEPRGLEIRVAGGNGPGGTAKAERVERLDQPTLNSCAAR